jgi:predicted transcriptional regulator
MRIKNSAGSPTATLTVRIPLKLKRRLEDLAVTTAGNRSRLAVQALESYIEDRETQLAKIDQGRRDAVAGRLVSHRKVKRYLQSWGSTRKLPPPARG